MSGLKHPGRFGNPFDKNHHVGWVQGCHGLTSRPRETAGKGFLDFDCLSTLLALAKTIKAQLLSHLPFCSSGERTFTIYGCW